MKIGDTVKFQIPTSPNEQPNPIREGKIVDEYPSGDFDVAVNVDWKKGQTIYIVRREWMK